MSDPINDRPPGPRRPGGDRSAGWQPVGDVRLLEHLPDLAADLAGAHAAAAHRVLTVPAIELTAGRCEPSAAEQDPRVAGSVFGVAVITGLLAREVTLLGRTSTSLYGPGDVLDLRSDGSGSLTSGARMICPDLAVIGLLDDRVLAAMRRWPHMIARLFGLTMRQLERSDLNTAVAALERVEDRLLAFFWLLADRWGHWRSDGVAIDQPLTHEAIGRLIGARRPTVSLGLRSLAEQSLLQRRSDGTWLLSADSLSRVTGVGVAEPEDLGHQPCGARRISSSTKP